MPSGYTAIIDETDRDLSLNEFAWRCTKAFQYEDLREKIVIIEESNSSIEYYEERIKETEKDLAYYESIKDDHNECNKVFLINEEIELEWCRDEIIRRNKLREKYNRLFNKIREWNPPEVYMPLKKFMAEQLKDSIYWDCDTDYYDKRLIEYKDLTGKDYVSDLIDELKEDMEHYRGELKKYKDNLKMRNDYMEGLVKEIGLPNDYQ